MFHPDVCFVDIMINIHIAIEMNFGMEKDAIAEIVVSEP